MKKLSQPNRLSSSCRIRFKLL